MIYQINDYIDSLGENFDKAVNEYFEQFKSGIHQRYSIPSQLVEDYKDTICLLKDIDTCLIKVVELRTSWLEPTGYEIDIDWATQNIEALHEQ